MMKTHALNEPLPSILWQACGRTAAVMGLGTKDLGILCVCVVAVWLTTSQEGGLSLRVSWFHPIVDSTTSSSSAALSTTYRNGHFPDLSEKLPLPIITDMDGDGLNEIVLATREPKLKILQLKNAASIEHMQAKAAAVAAAAVNAGDGSTSSAAATAAAAADAAEAALLGETLVVKHEVSLLAHSHKMRSGRQPAAIATGYLRPYSSHRSRKQIVVVVTDGFEILVYNHKLKLLWHRSMDADMRHSFLYEIAININSHSLRLNDTGSVVIGARQAFKADIAKYAIHKNWKKRGKKAHAKLHPQHSQQQTAHSDADKASNPDKPGGGSGHAKREGDDHSHGTHGGSHSKTEFPDLERDEEHNVDHFEAKHHFSFYAFEGRSGRLRWKHEAHDFYEETAAHTILKPQHAVHSGEQDWRSFRYDILHHVLPHGWWSREDTRLDLIELHRHRHKRAGKDRHLITANHHHTHHKHRLHHSTDRSTPHMKSSSQSAASTQSVSPAGVFQGFGGLLPHNPSEHIEHPNAIVAHLKDGIEIIHMYTGRTICRLSLKTGVMHVDVNGDGVIDHIESVASMPANSPLLHGPRPGQTRLPKCLGLVSSGIPPQQQLFNTTICPMNSLLFAALSGIMPTNPMGLSQMPTEVAARLSGGEAGSLLGGIGPGAEDDRHVFATLPAVMLDAEASNINTDYIESEELFDVSEHIKKWKSVWYTNDGTVTAAGSGDHHHNSGGGHGGWQTKTDARWLLNDDESDESIEAELKRNAIHPSLTPYSLRSHDGLKDHLIVIGADVLAVVAVNDGKLRFEYPLIEVAVSTPVWGDYNHDYWNDLIITSPKGYYGLSIERSIGFQFFTILTGVLMLLLVAAIAWNVSGGDGTSEDASAAAGVKMFNSKRLRGKQI